MGYHEAMDIRGIAWAGYFFDPGGEIPITIPVKAEDPVQAHIGKVTHNAAVQLKTPDPAAAAVLRHVKQVVGADFHAAGRYYIGGKNINELAGIRVVAVDATAVVVGDNHRVAVFKEDHIVRPRQVFGDENLGIFTLIIVFQNLPGWLAKIGYVDDVNI